MRSTSTRTRLLLLGLVPTVAGTLLVVLVFLQGYSGLVDHAFPSLRHSLAFRSSVAEYIAELREYVTHPTPDTLVEIHKALDDMKTSLLWIEGEEFLGENGQTLLLEAERLREIGGRVVKTSDSTVALVHDTELAEGRLSAFEVSGSSTNMAELTSAWELRSYFHEYLGEVREYSANPSAEAHEEMAAISGRVLDKLAAMERGAAASESQTAVQRLRESFQQLTSIGEHVVGERDREEQQLRDLERVEDSLAEHVSIVVQDVEAATQKRTTSLLGLVIGAGAIALLVALIWVIVTSRGISDPIRRLKNAVERFGEGYTEVQFQDEGHSCPAEIASLGRSFNRMAGEVRDSAKGLRESHTQLESRVEDRTVELRTANLRLNQEVRDRVEAEAFSRNQQDALARVTRAYTMGELVANISHELNQPLAAVGNYAHACMARLKNGLQDEQALVPALEKLVGQVERAGEIVLRVRRFVSGAPTARVSENVSSLIRDSISYVQYEADHDEVEVQLDLLEGGSNVMVDGTQIEQVLVNLFRNSLEAMSVGQAHRELRVGSVERDGSIVVTVSDTGGGVTHEVRASLFEPFVSTKTDGLGMGLAISRTIIESHGGRIWESAASGPGAEFCFSIPTESREGKCLDASR